jgi:hypothetical protein
LNGRLGRSLSRDRDVEPTFLRPGISIRGVTSRTMRLAALMVNSQFAMSGFEPSGLCRAVGMSAGI